MTFCLNFLEVKCATSVNTCQTRIIRTCLIRRVRLSKGADAGFWLREQLSDRNSLSSSNPLTNRVLKIII
jgi:hypothetical protein